ncbi:biotin--[acetyl-CoA-carboxylase] ligase [Gracilimonas mengyeensis]|uniref:BirA family transcriptional regulator, biotin operon repressor / biotin-[acetyl-CoA-carboxylase] ligase n=1 Tax=Gracilimonas mengyeensis TaxID=1302730 RepID=A0A521DLA3_9BACT|nr:biotin--[acetyl-CoA-carboxylase] ligase [Gracilimonas mengyeensis]SMO72408.1 BirA family transcriptional regulator, biotin operon repressor / biotin-[acetyl-CoA-carboxylase] ligase [Gracilimonas mengyeensis]
MFDQHLYKQKLATSWLGRSFYFFEEIPSTNSYCKTIKMEEGLHGAAFLTDYQTGGRGQHKRKWETSKKQNLTFSLVFCPQRKDGFILLTLACALAVLEAINDLEGLQAKLKWPNDVLVDSKKLCGILTETQFTGNQLEKIIIGIGLNVNQSKFPASLDDYATSIALEKGSPLDRETLLANIFLKLEKRFHQWENYNPRLPRSINKHMIGFGKWTRLSVNGEMLDGKHKFLGIDGTGKLLTLDKDLELNTYTYEQVRVFL